MRKAENSPRLANTKGKRTKTRILEESAKQFAERGYSGTALSSVMEACGLTKGGFYSHFSSREALYLESMKALLERERREYRPASSTASPELRLRAFLKWMGQCLSGNNSLGRQFLWMLVEPHIKITKHLVAEVFHPTYNELRHLLSGFSHSPQTEVIAPSLLAVALLYDVSR